MALNGTVLTTNNSEFVFEWSLYSGKYVGLSVTICEQQKSEQFS